MKLKVRPIGNSRGVILPQPVLWHLTEPDSAESRIEVTLIGPVAVLTKDGRGSELDLRAALAYASVKAKRAAMLEALTVEDEGDEYDRGFGRLPVRR
jgi:antitoxin component of MazEF toxin-antitoxin module